MKNQVLFDAIAQIGTLWISGVKVLTRSKAFRPLRWRSYAI